MMIYNAIGVLAALYLSYKLGQVRGRNEGFWYRVDNRTALQRRGGR